MITFQNLQATSNIGYRTIVCGNLLNGATFATALPNTFNPLTYSLEINGSTIGSNTINLNKGSLALGPYPSNRFKKQNSGNIQYTIDGSTNININQGNAGATVQSDPTLPSRCTTMISDIIYLSQSLSQLSPNNNVTIPSGQPGPLNFNVNNVDVNGIAVFNVSLSAVFNNNNVQSIQLNPLNSNLQLVVINVYGLSATWSSSNLIGNWFGSATTGQSQTIWNFYQATSLTFGSSMKGTVLAPYATLTLQSDVNGAVAVNILYAYAAVSNALTMFPNCTSAPGSTAGQY